MPADRPGVQQLAAEFYIRKRDTYAREVANRNGTPYEHETVTDQRAYELFYQRDPSVDEQQAWLDAAQKVAAGQLPPNRVTSYVVEKVYPARIAVTQGGGRTDLKAQTEFVNRMVARRQREVAGVGPTPTTVGPTPTTVGPTPTTVGPTPTTVGPTPPTLSSRDNATPETEGGP